jgi:hypothetical protein
MLLKVSAIGLGCDSSDRVQNPEFKPQYNKKSTNYMPILVGNMLIKVDKR